MTEFTSVGQDYNSIVEWDENEMLLYEYFEHNAS